ncbi:MAG TPA: hypothetical protein PKM25_19845, partial [Candidatus Ozemobacteraceae bacterium]|nr:hypothetical protein [Candidatus Ozemobacteraceae bacterium]
MGGNRIQGVPSANATQAQLIPPPNNFYFSTASLISSGSQVLLQIPSFSRRARLYQDFYQPVNELQLRRTTPVTLSKVYLAKNADMTGGSFPLSAEFVDFNIFKDINTDYASTTVTIPLNDSALKTLLSWGSRKIYIACEQGAFRDMWNYDSARFPTSGGGSELPFNPSGESPRPPTVFSVALGPVVSQTNHPSNTSIQLVKGPALGTTFEVSFETATLSNNIRLPIDQSLTPVLKLLGPDANPLNPIYTATFVGWTTHQMDSVTRTVAQFQNPSTWSAVTLQRASCSVEISNFRDLFESSLLPPHATTTTLVYDLSQKMTGTNGFGGASLPLVLDNQAPKLS